MSVQSRLLAEPFVLGPTVTLESKHPPIGKPKRSRGTYYETLRHVRAESGAYVGESTGRDGYTSMKQASSGVQNSWDKHEWIDLERFVRCHNALVGFPELAQSGLSLRALAYGAASHGRKDACRVLLRLADAESELPQALWTFARAAKLQDREAYGLRHGRYVPYEGRTWVTELVGHHFSYRPILTFEEDWLLDPERPREQRRDPEVVASAARLAAEMNFFVGVPDSLVCPDVAKALSRAVRGLPPRGGKREPAA